MPPLAARANSPREILLVVDEKNLFAPYLHPQTFAKPCAKCDSEGACYWGGGIPGKEGADEKQPLWDLKTSPLFKPFPAPRACLLRRLGWAPGGLEWIRRLESHATGTRRCRPFLPSSLWSTIVPPQTQGCTGSRNVMPARVTRAKMSTIGIVFLLFSL